MLRRDVLKAMAATAAARRLIGAERDRLVAHAYIFVQDAQRRQTRHVDEAERICSTFAAAGFHSVEFMSDFFEPAVRDRTIKAVKAAGLKVPIVYVGGSFHEPAAAAQTHDKALAIAEAAKDAGTVAINTNPNPKPKRERKTDDELAVQARELNRLGEALAKRGVRLFYHTHDPEMAENAREWRHVLKNTDAKLVQFCMDTHWIFRGGQDPVALLEEAGRRTASLHLRNSHNRIWSETLREGDIDYAKVAAVLKRTKVNPYLVVELAYEKGTTPTWNLEDALKRSREYAIRVFGINT
jgi:inosose dehydratase